MNETTKSNVKVHLRGHCTAKFVNGNKKLRKKMIISEIYDVPGAVLML
jgi:hypothetical protein